MTEENYRALFDRASPGRDLVEDTLAAAERPRRKGVPTKRLAAALVCLALVLGVGNYQALAAGVQRMVRYFTGVGAAPAQADLLIQGETLQRDDGERLFLIEGAYQRDGLLTIPVDVLYRSEPATPESDEYRYRLTVYDGNGETLPNVYRTGGGEVQEISGGAYFSPSKLEESLSWLSQTYLPQGFVSAGSNCFLMKLPQGEEGPYSFALDAYTVGGGWEDTVWEGVLTLNTPQATETIQVSREIGEGTVTALVRPDGRSIAFYAQLAPEKLEAGESLFQFVVYRVWFIDEAGNRLKGYMRRYALAEDYLPEVRLVGEPEGEIVAIQVDQVKYNIIRTDQPMSSENQQYFRTYRDLNWAIDLT